MLKIASDTLVINAVFNVVVNADIFLFANEEFLESRPQIDCNVRHYDQNGDACAQKIQDVRIGSSPLALRCDNSRNGS